MPQRLLPLKPADQHTSTHTTHRGSAGRWEEHRGERDGHSLARPLSPHHPASPSQQERALNQRSKGTEGSEGREREERRTEGRKRDAEWVNERNQRKQGVKKVPWNEVFAWITCVCGCILFLHTKRWPSLHICLSKSSLSSWETFSLTLHYLSLMKRKSAIANEHVLLPFRIIKIVPLYYSN